MTDVVTSPSTRAIATPTTQSGTVSSNTGPPKGIIGGVIAVTVILILALAALCVLRRKRRHLRQVKPKPTPHAPTDIRPFYSISPARVGPLTKTKPGESLPRPKPAHPPNRKPEVVDEQPEDPFRDPQNNAGSDPSEPKIQETRDALANIQELTVQLETELQGLSTLARSGRLSDGDRTRLDEIRRIAGVAMPTNLRSGRVSSASTGTTYTSPPPSYNE